MPSNHQVLANITSISDPYEGILLDAYGVFWGGNSVGLFPGSNEIMENLIKKGKIVGILSNSTQLAANEIDKLRNYGLIPGRHFHFLTTSGEVAKEIFRHEQFPFVTPRKKYWLLGEPHPNFSSHLPIFKESSYTETSNIQEADFIYVSIPHINGEDQTNPDLFLVKLEQLKGCGIPMVCTNPDRVAHEGSPPRAVVRQGSIAKMYERIGGQVFYIGKPSSIVYSAAMNLFNQYRIIDRKQVLMVGDTPETDVKGARNFGMPAALVTKTGVMSDRISKDGFDHTVGRFSSDEIPEYFIAHL